MSSGGFSGRLDGSANWLGSASQGSDHGDGAAAKNSMAMLSGSLALRCAPNWSSSIPELVTPGGEGEGGGPAVGGLAGVGARGSWLRYTKATGLWAIYYDRNLKFHEHKRKRPTKTSRCSWTTSRPAATRSLGLACGSLTVNIVEDNLSYMRTEAPLLAPIFRSDGQARLLSTLLLTGDELSITDLAKRAGLAYPTAHREVARLVDAGILSERQVGRTRLIRANGESPLVDPLREILTVATGPVVMLAEELARIDGIESAFLYGSFAARMLGDAGPAPHDIDVMVLGQPDVDAVYEACARIEAAVHRPVNPTILTPEEFAAPSAFLDNVRSGPAFAVIGELPWR